MYILFFESVNPRYGKEAGLRFFINNALSTIMFLYGLAWLYSETGSTDFSAMGAISSSLPVSFAVMLMGISLGFKSSAAPFHWFLPDLYQGGGLPAVFFLATASKVTVFLVLLNFSAYPGFSQSPSFPIFMTTMIVASFLISGFGALIHNNVRRFLAYSSIGHTAFLLLGFCTLTYAGQQATLIYMGLYVIGVAIIFTTLVKLGQEGMSCLMMDDIMTLKHTYPVHACALGVGIFWLSGIPPSPLFFGKISILCALVDQEMYELVIAALSYTILSGSYYFWFMWKLTTQKLSSLNLYKN